MLDIRSINNFLADKDIDAVMVTSEVNLMYCTGLNFFEGVVLVTKYDKAFCFTDFRYIEIAEQLKKSGYTVSTVPKNDYFGYIGSICKELCIQSLGFEDQSVSCAQFKKIKEKIKCKYIGVSENFLELRSVKSYEETDNIKAAQKIAEKAFDILLGEISPGMSENECKARLEYLMSLAGSERPAFPTILISGKKTSMPHGVPSSKKIENGDFITFDFGAVYNGYCSDMTRTVAVGKVSGEMKHVYSIVLEAQFAAIEAAFSGAIACDVDNAARKIISDCGYGEYFGHSTGHGVGLEVHEEPRVSYVNTKPLKVGNVITIEPGIYIPGKFGVRIEDMLYLSAHEKTNLTNYPKNLIII